MTDILHQFLLRVPESERWKITDAGIDTSLPMEAALRVHADAGQITGDPVLGSRVHAGYKVVNYVGHTTPDQMTIFIADFSLDWEILAVNDMAGSQIKAVDPDALIDYVDDIVTRDADGNETGRTRPTELCHLGKFAGWPCFEVQASS